MCPSRCCPQPVASKFFIFVGFLILCQLAATSIALAVSALCREVDMSGELPAGRGASGAAEHCGRGLPPALSPQPLLSVNLGDEPLNMNH